MIRQDIGWFDSNSPGEITTRLSGDVTLIQDGMGEKIPQSIQFTTTFFAGFIIAFVYGWRLALVLCAVFPLLAGAAAVMAALLGKSTREGQDSYAKAGSIAEQSISSMRTVVAFGVQDQENARESLRVLELELCLVCSFLHTRWPFGTVRVRSMME